MEDPELVRMVADALAGSAALKGLTDEERELAARHMDVVDLPAHATVLHEGGVDRDMYFVVSGRARVTRGARDLGPIERGEHFGELALMAGAPRSASVVAETRLLLAKLDVQRYGLLAARDPALALKLTHAVIAGLRRRLAGMTESAILLGEGRSIPRRTRITVQIGDERREVPPGAILADLLPSTVEDRPVVAGLVDRRVQSLLWPIGSDCTVVPLTTGHWEGRRIYQDSLGLLLLEAAATVDPGLVLRLEHSVGFARRVSLHGIVETSREKLAAQLEDAMLQLVLEDLPLREELWTVDEARAHFEIVGWRAPIELLRTWRHPTVVLASYGTVHAIRTQPLLPRTGRFSGFSVHPDDDDGLVLVYGPDGSAPHQGPTSGEDEAAQALTPSDVGAAARNASRRTRAMTSEQDRWLELLGVASVGEFNREAIGGRVEELIRVSEGYQEKRIGQIADAIAARRDQVKVVCVAGPSSSGKTTFIKRLHVQLQVDAIHPVGLSLDDYYVDRADTPRDVHGEYDYEAVEALRTELLGQHLAALLRGESVRTARYDFPTGRSAPSGGPLIALGPQSMLLVEGIHGLNPRLLATLPSSSVFRIYICPLAELPFDNLTRVHASDVRLLRRIVRDRHSRGSVAADNIARWTSVRRGEQLHIFPFQHHADAVFDSSLIYELSVLKVYAERYLLEVPQDHASYATAHRLLKLLDHFVTIYPDHVPPTSILREFIGGSGFKY